MSYLGFDVLASDEVHRHYLFAHEAKEAAKTLVAQGCVKWAVVIDRESLSIIGEHGDPDAIEEVSCAEALKNFCTALANSTEFKEDVKLVKVEDAAAGWCYVRFGSIPMLSGSRKRSEAEDVILRLASGSLEDWNAGRVSLKSVCHGAQIGGRLGWYSTQLFRAEPEKERAAVSDSQ